MKRKITIIGVPSSAGAHWPGQEKTPAALRNAGLITSLENAGFDVIDSGDMAIKRFTPDKNNRTQQNLTTVVEIARAVSDKVYSSIKDNCLPLVIGGDCTIEIGVVSAFLRHYEELGLMYLDGHTDLNTPASSSSGILDSMGVAHLIGVKGISYELSHIGPRFPLLSSEKIVLFGNNPRELNNGETAEIEKHHFRNYPITKISGRTKQTAIDALKYIEGKTEQFVIHFDVDVIDFTDLPVADVPQFSRGMLFDEVVKCLSIFTSSPRFKGLTITEFNPDHVDGIETIKYFIEKLTQSLSKSLLH